MDANPLCNRKYLPANTKKTFYNVLNWCKKGDEPFLDSTRKRKPAHIGKHFCSLYINVFQKLFNLTLL